MSRQSTPWICQIRHASAHTAFCLPHISNLGMWVRGNMYTTGGAYCTYGFPVLLLSAYAPSTYGSIGH